MRLTADEQILRETLLDLLDSGPTSRPRWDFYEDYGSEGAQTEDGANRDRMEFVDEVINRIRKAKAPETGAHRDLGFVATIRLEGCQFKSLEIAREVARGFDLIEKYAGIHSVSVQLDECFVCPDMDLDALNQTPMEEVLAEVLRQQLAVNADTRTTQEPQYPQAIGRFTRPSAPETMDLPSIGRVVTKRGLHQLVVEKGLMPVVERLLRDNPPPMVIDDIDERDIPRKLDPRPTSEIVSTLVQEVAEEHARLLHLDAARKWGHVADIEQLRLECGCLNPIQTALAATGIANEASQAAPNIVAFTATIAALTACALRDAPAAAEAHRRAAEAYSATQEGV